MFKFLARIAEKYKYPIILFWIAVTVVLVMLAPSLSSVGVTDDSQFLPSDAESVRTQELVRTRFASTAVASPGSAILVVHNPDGLTAADQQAAQQVNDWLLSDQAPAVISAVNSPLTNTALSATMISQDQTTLLISLSLSESSASATARAAVEQIRAYIAGLDQSTAIYVTGQAGVSSDVLTSINQTIDKATLVTVILVIVLLLLIYRSPVAIFIPLITIGVSYLIARSLAGFIAQAGVNVSTLVDAYLVVTLFGIGTDYCLFIISRYKEELFQHDRSAAAGLTMQRIGPVILASATTVIVSLLCLIVSRFGMIRNSGLILALGVVITLLAGLTLTPALIAAFGRRIFWPAGLKHKTARTPGFWSKVGTQVVRRPLFFIIPIVIVLALPYLALPQVHYSSSLIAQMPEDMDSVAGYQVLEDHFPTGKLNPADVLIEAAPGTLWTPQGQAAVIATVNALEQIEGVTGTLYYGTPAPELDGLSAQIQSLAQNLGPTSLSQLAALKNMESSLTAIAVQYPGVTTSANFQAAVAALQQISRNSASLNPADSQKMLAAAALLKPALSGLADSLANLAEEFRLESETDFSQWLRTWYFSTDGGLCRFNVYTSVDPYDPAGSDLINTIRETSAATLASAGLSDARAYTGGTAADQTDILTINNADFLHVLGLAIVGILVVTGLLLRSLVAPLYMIITVLFNFFATLGISAWLFFDILDHNAMIYMLPIFVFVILVAVGADYNIFLVTRIREECQQKPLKEALRHAVSNTGGVITSCGIILAGTFATLTTAPLQMVLQIGAAIAIGVLIDTFIVRALLIPSIAALLGRLNWWPSRIVK